MIRRWRGLVKPTIALRQQALTQAIRSGNVIAIPDLAPAAHEGTFFPALSLTLTRELRTIDAAHPPPARNVRDGG